MSKNLGKEAKERSQTGEGMRKNRRVLAAAVSLALAGGMNPVQGAQLGQLAAYSFLNEPLSIRVLVRETEEGEFSKNPKAKIADESAYQKAGLRRPLWAARAKVIWRHQGQGQGALEITTQEPLEEPLSSLIIEVEIPGGKKTVRTYALILDPREEVKGQDSSAPDLFEATPKQMQGPKEQRSAQGKIGKAQRNEPIAPAPKIPAVPTGAVPKTESKEPVTLPARPPLSASAPKAQKTKPSAKVSPDAPLAASDASVAPSVPVAAPAAGFITVKPGDTLAQIALNHLPAGATVDQAMQAILAANPDAFAGSNINRLSSGSQLRLPSSEEAKALSEGDARKASRKQAQEFEDWKRGYAKEGKAAQSQAPEGKAPRAALKAPEAPGAKAPAQESADGKLVIERKGKGASKEDSIALDKKLKETRERIVELEKIESDLKRLLEIKSKDLAAAQEKAKKAQEEQAAQAASAAAKALKEKEAQKAKPAAKAEASKAEAAKAEASKAEAAKAEAAKAETAKAEAAKAEAAKAEAAKAEAAKAEAAKAEAAKAEAAKAEAAKAEAAKAEAAKAEAAKAEAAKAETPKAEASKAEAPKAEAPKAEAPKAEAPKAEAKKAPEPKKPEPSFMEEVEGAVPGGWPSLFGILGALVFGAGAAFFLKRRKKKNALASSFMTRGEETFPPSKTTGASTGPYSERLTASEPGAPKNLTTEEDYLQEADALVAYGKIQESLDLMTKAQNSFPGSLAFASKICEIAASAGARDWFERYALEIAEKTNRSGILWEQVESWGREAGFQGALEQGVSAPASGQSFEDFLKGNDAPGNMVIPAKAQVAPEPAPGAKKPKELDFSKMQESAPGAQNIDLNIDTAERPALDFDIGSKKDQAPALDISLDLPASDAPSDGLDLTLNSDAPASGNSIEFDLDLNIGEEKGAGAKSPGDALSSGSFMLDVPDSAHAPEGDAPIDGSERHPKDEEWRTMLDLANAYLEMNDRDGAAELLNDLAKNAEGEAQEKAKELVRKHRL